MDKQDLKIGENIRTSLNSKAKSLNGKQPLVIEHESTALLQQQEQTETCLPITQLDQLYCWLLRLELDQANCNVTRVESKQEYIVETPDEQT